MSNNYWTDRAQNKRIEQAEAQLASERRARSRLAAQMQARHGDLEGQIARLTTAFVALLEHEDIRSELAQHSDAAAVRRFAREVVAATIVTGSGVVRDLAEPADVPGYWLAAAARALASVGPDDSGDADDADDGRVRELLAEAVRRDPVRTAAFLTLLDCQARRQRWSAEHLSSVLPSGPATRPGADSQVSLLQREVWRAVAEDRLGAAARKELVEHLVRQVELIDPATVDAAIVGAADAGGRAAAATRTRRTTETQAVAASAVAAPGRLEALGAAVAGTGLVAPPADDPTVSPRALRTSAAYGADPTPATPTEPEEAEDPLADCLRALVDAGSPAEVDTLRRMAEVRADLGYDVGERGPDIDAPVGTVLDLLLADLRAPTGSPTAGAHGVALDVLAPALLRVTDRLQAEAATPVPASTTIEVGTTPIEITATGTTHDWRTPATAVAVAATPIRRWLVGVATAGAVVGVIGFGLGFVASGFFFLAFLGAATAGVGVAADRLARTERTRRVDRELRDVERRIAEESEAIGRAQQRRTDGLETARLAAQSIGQALA